MGYHKECYFYTVSEDNIQRSNLWKLIIEKNDECYLMSTINGKDIKVSFHKSGEIHVALTSELTKKLGIRNQERYFSKKTLATEDQVLLDSKNGNKIDISSKYEVAHCLMFVSNELNNIYDETEFSSKTEDFYALQFNNKNSIIELWFCIAGTHKTHIENFSIMDKIMSVRLPTCSKELIVLGTEYSMTEDLNNTFSEAKQKALQMISEKSKDKVKQITVFLSGEDEPDSTVELNLN